MSKYSGQDVTNRVKEWEKSSENILLIFHSGTKNVLWNCSLSFKIVRVINM